MNYMKKEWQTLEAYFPGLRQKLNEYTFPELEVSDSQVVEIFRAYGGPGLMVASELGGKGAGAVDAVRVHRALGVLSPSLAIAATMHNFTVAFLAEYAFYGDTTLRYLESIAKKHLFVASGFAEGRSGANILDASMVAKKVDGGYLVSGTKKPCSISTSMDYITASLKIQESDGTIGQRCIAIIPADSEGIRVSPFWSVRSLAGAQSMEVTLTDVFVGDDDLFLPDQDVPLDAVEAGGFLWFELIVTASYLGVASSLVDRVLTQKRGNDVERMLLVSHIEMASRALEGIAFEIESFTSPEDAGEAIVADVLLVRYGVQKLLGDIACQATELLGGMHFIGDPAIEYTLACCAPLAFHPPSRVSVAPALDQYMAGGSLELA